MKLFRRTRPLFLTIASLAGLASAAACSTGPASAGAERSAAPQAEVLGIVVTPEPVPLPGNVQPALAGPATASTAPSEVTGLRRASLSPSAVVRNADIEPALRSGVALFADNRIAQLAGQGHMELHYWAQTNVVAATVNHGLAGTPDSNWSQRAVETVERLGPQFWSTDVVDRFGRMGTDWSVDGPHLLVIDEANNGEIVCAAETMIGFTRRLGTVSSQDLIDSCLP